MKRNHGKYFRNINEERANSSNPTRQDKPLDPVLSEATSLLARTQTHEHRLFRVSAYRWVVIFSLFSSLSANYTMQSTFYAVEEALTETYNLERFTVAYCGYIFLIPSTLLGPLLAWIVSRKGPEFAARLSATLLVIGAWIRVAVNFNFTYVLVGSSISALGAAFQNYLVAVTSERWFSPLERALSSSIAIIGTCFGSAMTFGISALMVDPEESVEAKQNSVYNYLVLQSIVITVLSLLLFFLYKEAPDNAPVPPSDLSVP